MHKKTLAQLSELLQNKKISSVELTNHYLERITNYDAKVNAFITVTKEQALLQAKLADSKLAKGEANPLCGIPIAHKDLFCTKDVLTTACSKMLHNFVAPYDATIVTNLANSGMVMLGKLNMDEFAMGSSTENSAFKITNNPWNLETIPGGSSGGSAAAVASGLAPIATGTDTGGSIRQPASLTGTCGIKPTYGRVSRWGQIAFASSLDQAGLFAKSAEDLAMTLQSMAGYDEKDSTSVNRAKDNYTKSLNEPINGLKIGVPEEYFSDQLDPQVANKVKAAITEFEKMGAKILSINLPDNEVALATYYVLAPAEASSNLARYDGVRYGYQSDKANSYQELFLKSRDEGFGNEVKRRIMIGTYVLSAGYYDAYYLKAQQTRRYIRDGFLSALKQCDVIMGPVTSSVAWKIGEKVDNPMQMYLSDLYTIPANLAGLPAMSIPVGLSDGLPVGLHMVGNYFAEATLLNLAHKYQLNTDYHLNMPKQFA